jgi:ABC-type nitrate/sulfonate/bicarbonate transport system substrate-binding protein
MAKELGCFAKYGLDVHLRREIGWAAVRDKLIYGELDAAHALATMPFAATLGLGSAHCDCVAGVVLNIHGNAITLSRELWDRGVRDARGLRREIDSRRDGKVYTFGTVFPYSSHAFLLREWLLSGGIRPDEDVRLAVVPPPSMFASLKAGNLDGYCVGEPWNTLAVQAGIGWCPTTSAKLAPGHPEKVLMVRRDFAVNRPEEHARLVAALLEAGEWCDQPENREQLITTLARPEYVNATAEALRPGLTATFNSGFNRLEPDTQFVRFHGHDVNEPGADKAAWILNHLMRAGAVKDRSALEAVPADRVFLTDVYDFALHLHSEKQNPDSEPLHEPLLT